MILAAAPYPDLGEAPIGSPNMPGESLQGTETYISEKSMCGLGSIEISLRFGDSNSFTHFALALVKLFHDESIGWRFALALLIKQVSARRSSNGHSAPK
jgi:hypothetical protein